MAKVGDLTGGKSMVKEVTQDSYTAADYRYAGASIGSFGPSIVFSTSDARILTLAGLQQTVSGKWAEHERIGIKNLPEFTGPALRTVSFNLKLDVALGLRPRAMLELLERMCEEGTAERLVIGGRPVGRYGWVVKSVSETWDRVLNRGELMSATASLSLGEYL